MIDDIEKAIRKDRTEFGNVLRGLQKALFFFFFLFYGDCNSLSPQTTLWLSCPCLNPGVERLVVEGA